MKKKTIILIAAILTAVIGLGCFFLTHTHAGGGFYPKNKSVLDLREKTITPEQYEELHTALPECTILWNVPLSERSASSDSQELVLSDLTESDVEMLRYFPELQNLDVSGCENYPLLVKLQADRPDLYIAYTVTIDGTTYPHTAQKISISSISDEEISLLQYLPGLTSIDAQACGELDQLLKISQQYPECEPLYYVNISGSDVISDTAELVLTGAEPKALLEAMPHLPKLTSVELKEPVGDLESLAALCKQYPHVSFHWELDVLGVLVSTEDTEVDFSGVDIPSIEAVESAMACFPNLEQIYLGECGIDNEALAAYRDRVREDYKVVWLLKLGLMPVRTDETTFMPGRPSERYYVCDKYLEDFRYCEDMICVDVGHYLLFNCEWAAHMPKLKYLILTDTRIMDLSPLVGLENLVFLELSNSYIEDYSPLVQCKSIEDLNLGRSEGTAEDAQVVKQMTWLKRLWWAFSPLTQEELQAALPDTEVKVFPGSSNSNGWRKGKHYYDMRDLLGMYYHEG